MVISIRKFIFLSIFGFSLVFNSIQSVMGADDKTDIKDEAKSFINSPIRPKQDVKEVVYRTPEKLNASGSIATPLRLEMANSEISRLKSTVDILVNVITDDRFVRPAFAHLFRAIKDGQDEHTIGNLLRRVETVRNPPFLELPIDFQLKIRRSVTDSTLYLINNELSNAQNGRRTDYPTINYLTFQPFRPITTPEITSLVSSLRGLSVRETVEDQTIPRLDALRQLVLKSLQEPVVGPQKEIDLGALPKLEVSDYHDLATRHPGVYSWYLVGSAIPDGDCFFHAIFTRNGQVENLIKQEALRIRQAAVDSTRTDLIFQGLMRTEILGYYRDMFLKQKYNLVPEPIRKMLDENDEYAILRNTFLERANGDLNQLPPKYRNTVKHTDNDILNVVNLNDIPTYMNKYLDQQNDEYYIEVPVGRNTHSGISEIIARTNNITVNYFLLNQDRGALNYAGTVGNGAVIHNVLINGRHFYPLYNDAEGSNKQSEFIQSLNNFIEFMYTTYFPK